MPGISGRIAASSRMGLEELLEQQLLQEKLDEARQQRALDNALRERQMGLQEREFGARESETAASRAERTADRTRVADVEAGEKRTLGNMAGVIEMLGSGMDPQTAMREIAMTGLRGGVEPPRMLDRLMPVEKAPTRHLVTTPGPGGRPLRRLVNEEELLTGVPEYREPKEPRAGTGQWVIRNGEPTHTMQIQPGDRPYDAVAARQGAGGTGPSPYSLERGQRIVESVDDLMGDVSRMTTGVGSVLSGVPESGARDFKARLDTLKAGIGFKELTEMREASKTGGALGQVSDRELTLLTSALGALDQGQSPAQLKAQLQKIKDSAQRWDAARGGSQEPRMTPSHGGGTRRVDPLGIRRPQ